METYCVICKKNAKNKNSSVRKTEQNKLVLLWNCAVSGKKKSNFIKNKELNNTSNDYFKMNKIIYKFLLTEDKFTLEMHLKQPGFTYIACRSFTKHC